MLHKPEQFFRMMLLLPPLLLIVTWLLFPETGTGEFSWLAIQIGWASYIAWAMVTVILSFRKPWPAFRRWLSWAPFSYWIFTLPVFISTSGSIRQAVIAWAFGAIFAIPIAYGMLGITAFTWYQLNPHKPGNRKLNADTRTYQ